MRVDDSLSKQIAKLGLLILMLMGMPMSADAGLFGVGRTNWKEEVLLHDGSRVIVNRGVVLKGRREIGQEPPIGEQRLSFTHPDTGEEIHWEDGFSEDIRSASFLPMLLDVHNKTVYLVTQTMGCLAYNKWGRPNPPYVIFRYEEKTWKRIDLKHLPLEIRTPNLIFSSPRTEAKKLGTGDTIPAPAIRALYDNYRNSESKTILREPLAKERCPQYSSGPKAPIPVTPNTNLK